MTGEVNGCRVGNDEPFALSVPFQCQTRTMAFIEPEYERKSFTCPHCEAITGQNWQPTGQISDDEAVRISRCQHEECGRASVWVGPFEG